jgi:UDP-GlcNAc:undecaprenyl-phosphate/decaprenyl-phosphate GlcNAc-1-phosphate transferase
VRLEELPFILLVLLASAAVAYVLTPVAMRVAIATHAIDEPDSGRRVHDRPIPRAGGMAVAAAFVGVGGLAIMLYGFSMPTGPFPRQYSWAGNALQRSELVALFAGTALAAAFGYIDDRWQIRARWQFLGQLVLAAFAIYQGVMITFVANPFGFLDALSGDSTLLFSSLGREGAAVVSVIVTAIWIIGMINSINFIDGLDGLSTGVALIAAVTLGIISLAPGVGSYSPLVALLCAALAGALAGFLPWNFHPARVFIGTTGVMAMGFALAVLSILGTAKVAVALLILGVPIIDAFWIITRRLINRHSPFTPDRGHLHHRLLDLGLSHRGAVLLIYGICIALAVASLLMARGAGPLYGFVAVLVASGLLLLLVAARSGGDQALEASSYEEPREPPTRA